MGSQFPLAVSAPAVMDAWVFPSAQHIPENLQELYLAKHSIVGSLRRLR